MRMCFAKPINSPLHPVDYNFVKFEVNTEEDISCFSIPLILVFVSICMAKLITFIYFVLFCKYR